MVHDIIDNLSEKQMITTLRWSSKKIIGDDLLKFDIEKTETLDYARLFLHLIVEADSSDTIGLQKQLIKNAEYFEKERTNEQKSKGDFIDILALVVSLFSWLNIKPAIEIEEIKIIESEIKIKISKKQFERLDKNGLIIDSSIILQDKNGEMKKVKLRCE